MLCARFYNRRIERKSLTRTSSRISTRVMAALPAGQRSRSPQYSCRDRLTCRTEVQVAEALVPMSRAGNAHERVLAVDRDRLVEDSGNEGRSPHHGSVQSRRVHQRLPQQDVHRETVVRHCVVCERTRQRIETDCDVIQAATCKAFGIQLMSTVRGCMESR